MDGFDTARARGGRGRALLVALLVLLAFAGGAAAAAWGARAGRWFAPAPAAQPIVVKRVVQAAPATAVAASTDPATLAMREGVLAGQLAALEARTAAAAADVAAAGGQAGRAEALLVVAAARRSLDRGQPLGYLEGQLRYRFGAGGAARAVAAVVDAGAQPVTREDLRLGLDNLAPALTTGADAGWLASLRRELGSLVVLREGGTPSPLAADRLARARRLLDAGQVEAARAEVARMPGAGGAGNWLAAARRYALARRALDALEGAALTGPGAPAR